jgi:Trk K+ transport system NAD-binding subunit
MKPVGAANTRSIRLRQRPPARVVGLYALALLYEFRFTLIALALCVFVGGMLHWRTRSAGGEYPTAMQAFFNAWMALLNQNNTTDPWYLALISGFYPLLGFVIIGEGIVRLSILLVSKKHGEKEWMKVMASVYRDHVVLCGLGKLGVRVLQELVATGVPIVVLEKDENNRFLPQANAMNVPVLVRNMKEDQSLIDAGVAYAQAVIIATNDDMANIEVAIDSRRLNPKIRVVMRLFEQTIAEKISGAFIVDAAFSASSLSAPMVAAMALETRTVHAMMINGVQYVAAEVMIREGSPLIGRSISDVERAHACRVLALTRNGNTLSPPELSDAIACGDTLIAHTASEKLTALASAAKNGLP